MADERSELVSFGSMRKQDELAVKEGCYFDEQSADFVCDFFERYLKHTMGEKAGEPFVLLDWQREQILRPLFGWKRADGTQRFSRGFIWTPKKQGKSTLSAGICLFYLMTGGVGAGSSAERTEVFGVATSREQAGIIYREAAAMVKKDPQLSERVRVLDSKKRLLYVNKNSFYQALAGETVSRGVEGINPNLTLIDEIHAMRSRILYDALAYASAARKNSLMLSVSTVGIADRSLIWWEQYEYSQRLLDGSIEDPYTFAYLTQADIECLDDFELCGDEEQWRKAMPSLGHTVPVDTIRQHWIEGKNSPAKQNAFRRYLLNLPTSQVDRVVPMANWYGNQIDIPDLTGRECYGGLDMASHEDLCSFCLYFPPTEDDERAYVLSECFCPKDKIQERKNKGMAFYSQWVNEGWITLAGSARIDAEPIAETIREAAEVYNIVEIGFDVWGADAVVNPLMEEGLPFVAVAQSMRGMTAGTRELLNDIEESRIFNDGNPVLAWCLANCAADQKADGAIRFSKNKSTDKIDAAVALAMARGRALANVAKSMTEPEIFF